MPDIRVGQNTSLQDLQKFTEQLGDNAKIRAKTHDDGSVTLYTSTKRDWGIKEFFTNHVTRRQDNAKQTLENLVQNLKDDPDISQDAKALLTNIKNALPQQGTGEMRGAQFKQIFQQAVDVRNEGLKFEAKLVEGLRTGDSGMLESCRDTIAGQIAQSIRDLPRDDQIKYSCSDGKDYMSAIALNLNRSLGEKAGGIGHDLESSSPEAKKFLEEVYQHAMTQLSDRVVDDQTIQVGGKTYTKDRELDKGGFGAVDLYLNKEDGTSIILKRPLLEKGGTMSDKFNEARDECLMHLKAQGNGTNENVIGLKGAMRTQDGGLVIALETAPFGSGYHVMEALKEGMKLGLVPPEVAKLANLTMLKDMLSGMKQMHEEGMMHQDVKPPNFLVGEGGKAKLSDFGTSVGSGTVESKTRLVDNPIWLAPELISGHSKLTNHTNTVEKMIMKATPIEVMRENFKGQIPDEDLEKMLTGIKEDREKRSEGVRERNPVSLTQGSDTWGIGVTAYQMLEGDDPFGYSKFMTGVEKKYTEFGSNPDNRVYKAPEGSNVKLTPEQELINGMMHPDPKQRLTPEQALNSEVFTKNDDVGGDKIREFLSNPIFRQVYKALENGEPVTDEMKNKLQEISQRVA